MVSQTIYMVKTIDWYGMATGVLDWSGGMMAGQALGGIFPALVNILVISLQVRICMLSQCDPDPSDPYVFGPPGSGSISQRYRYGFGSFYHPKQK
jgi:hypothetical protein